MNISFKANILKADSLPSNGEDMCIVQAYKNITFQPSTLLLPSVKFQGTLCMDMNPSKANVLKVDSLPSNKEDMCMHIYVLYMNIE